MLLNKNNWDTITQYYCYPKWASVNPNREYLCRGAFVYIYTDIHMKELQIEKVFQLTLFAFILKYYGTVEDP